jgi:ribonuclease P protein component
MDNRIHRSERLKNGRSIDRLFKEGKRLASGAFLLLYQLQEGNGHFRFALNVPKKKQKRASERNRSKRIVRELIRYRKGWIRQELGRRGLDGEFFFLYRKSTPPRYEEAEREMIQLLERWEEELQEIAPEARGGGSGS